MSTLNVSTSQVASNAGSDADQALATATATRAAEAKGRRIEGVPTHLGVTPIADSVVESRWEFATVEA